MRFEAKRCGVQFSPPSIVLLYRDRDQDRDQDRDADADAGRMRRRRIPVRSFTKRSDCSVAAERLKNHPRHRDYLEGVPQSQLEKLHIILQDHLLGFSLEHSLASFRLDPDEDLNKLEDEELARKKGQMDTVFEKNRKHRDDPDFVYDVEVDFPKTTQDKCSWDDESDHGF